MKEIKACFFGDSICFGQGISVHKGWITKISKSLYELYSGDTQCLVVNAGVNGNTTRLALERMPYDVQVHNYDILFIQLGMNDCNYWQTDRGVPRVSPQAFKANLNEIISRAQAFKVKKILMNTNHIATKDNIIKEDGLRYFESNSYYNEMIREVGSENPDVILNDIELCFKDAIRDGAEISDLLLKDGLHLSEEGHNLYYEFIFPRIKKVIKEVCD